MDDSGNGADDDVVEQSGHRFAALNWHPRQPPRGAVLLAAGLAAGLVLGLAGGYAAGTRHGAPKPPGTEAAGTLAGTGSAALAQTGPDCSVQDGHELQLGVNVTNQSGAPLTLGQIHVVLPLGGLRPLSRQWAPCGVPPHDQALLGSRLSPGASAWLTVTFQVLTKCPTALPVQFTVGLAQNGHRGSVSLPGFPDLGDVPYSGCPPSGI
jgi:hypothetical protein